MIDIPFLPTLKPEEPENTNLERQLTELAALDTPGVAQVVNSTALNNRG